MPRPTAADHAVHRVQCVARPETALLPVFVETQDRVGSKDFLLKHEFLAIMLGVYRPTVTAVLGALQHSGLISSKYGRIRVLKRKGLERASCECYEVIRAHFRRLRLCRSRCQWRAMPHGRSRNPFGSHTGLAPLCALVIFVRT